MDVRTVRRQLAALLPEARPTGEGEGTLELLATSTVDAPRLISATVLEGAGPLKARRVFGGPTPAFRAFLDGTQRSLVAAHLHGIPIVVGTAAAVIRERRNRRMHTWSPPLVETRLYAPRDLVGARAWESLTAVSRGQAGRHDRPRARGRCAPVHPQGRGLPRRPGAPRGARAAPGRAVVHRGAATSCSSTAGSAAARRSLCRRARSAW